MSWALACVKSWVSSEYARFRPNNLAKSYKGGIVDGHPQTGVFSRGGVRMRAYVFNRRNGAQGFGHVGWAFQWNDGDFVCGATENPSGKEGGRGDGKGFWTCLYPQSGVVHHFSIAHDLPAGHAPAYDTYKILDFTGGDAKKAWGTALWCKDQEFRLWPGIGTLPGRGRNCMDDAYDILAAFGVPNLPWPTSNPWPNKWFDAIGGAACPIPRGVSVEAVVSTATSAPEGEAVPPPWCIAGSKECLDLAAILDAARKEMAAPAI